MLGDFAALLANKYKNSNFAQKMSKDNKEFAEGFAAGCALVATADGKVGDDEYQIYHELIDSQDTLRVFNRKQLEDLFDKFVKKCRFNKREVWAELDQVPEALQPNIIDMMYAMADAEGGMDDNEKTVISTAVKRYRLNVRDWPGIPAI